MMSSVRQKKPRPGTKASSLAHGRPPPPPRVVVDLWGSAPAAEPTKLRPGYQRSRQKRTVDDNNSETSSELPAGITPQSSWGLAPNRNHATTDSGTSFNAAGFVPKYNVSSDSNDTSQPLMLQPAKDEARELADASGEDADDHTEAPSMVDPFDDGISAMHEPHSSTSTASADHSFSVFPTEGGVWDQGGYSSESLATGAGESGEDMSRLTSASWNATFSQPRYSPALGGGPSQAPMLTNKAPSPRLPPVSADESGWRVAEILAQARPGTRTTSECNEVRIFDTIAHSQRRRLLIWIIVTYPHLNVFVIEHAERFFDFYSLKCSLLLFLYFLQVASLIRAAPGSSLAVFSTAQLAQLAQHLVLRHVSASAAASDSTDAEAEEIGGLSMPPSNHQHYPVALFQEGDASVGFCMFLVPTAADSRSWWGNLSEDAEGASTSTVELFRRSALFPDDSSKGVSVPAVAPTATRVVLRGDFSDNSFSGDVHADRNSTNGLRVVEFDYDRELKPTASHYYPSSEGGLQPWWAMDQSANSYNDNNVDADSSEPPKDAKTMDHQEKTSNHNQGATKERLLAPLRTVGPFQTFGEDALEPMESIDLRNQDDRNRSSKCKSLHVHSFTAALHAPALIAVLPLDAYCQLRDNEQEGIVKEPKPPLNFDWLRGPHYRYMAEQRCLRLMESVAPFMALADPARRWLASQAQERQLPSGTAATAPGRTVRLVWLLDQGAYLATSTPATHNRAVAATKASAAAQDKKCLKPNDASSSPSEVLLGKVPGIGLVTSGHTDINSNNSSIAAAGTASMGPPVWRLDKGGDSKGQSPPPTPNHPSPIGEYLGVLGGMELLNGEDSYEFGCVAVPVNRGSVIAGNGNSVSPKDTLSIAPEGQCLKAFVVRRSAFEKAFLYGGGVARSSVVDRDGVGGRVKWQRPVGAASTTSSPSTTSMPLKHSARVTSAGPSTAMSPSSLLRRRSPESGLAVVNESDDASNIAMSPSPMGNQRASPLQGGGVVTLDEYFSSPSAPFLPQLEWEHNDEDGEVIKDNAEALPPASSSMLPYLMGGQRLSQSSSSAFRQEKLPYALPTKAYSAAPVNPLLLQAPMIDPSLAASVQVAPLQMGHDGKFKNSSTLHFSPSSSFLIDGMHVDVH